MAPRKVMNVCEFQARSCKSHPTTCGYSSIVTFTRKPRGGERYCRYGSVGNFNREARSNEGPREEAAARTSSCPGLVMRPPRTLIPLLPVVSFLQIFAHSGLKRSALPALR